MLLKNQPYSFPLATMFLALYILTAIQLAWANPTCSLVPPSSSGSPSPSKSGGPGGCTSASSGTIMAASWYASWHSSDFTLQDVSWHKYSVVIYAFA